MKSIKIKLLSICLMLFSAIILFSACDLFGGEKDGDGDSNSIGYVSDIYYDGTFFCYEMKEFYMLLYLYEQLRNHMLRGGVLYILLHKLQRLYHRSLLKQENARY